jgi:hypothetical protein
MGREHGKSLLEGIARISWNGIVGCSAIAGEIDGPAIAYYKGGLLCQSAHFNRAGAAARRRTVSAHA